MKKFVQTAKKRAEELEGTLMQQAAKIESKLNSNAGTHSAGSKPSFASSLLSKIVPPDQGAGHPPRPNQQASYPQNASSHPQAPQYAGPQHQPPPPPYPATHCYPHAAAPSGHYAGHSVAHSRPPHGAHGAPPPPPPYGQHGGHLGPRPSATAVERPMPVINAVLRQTYLTEQQILAFARDGFLILRGVVPPLQIAAALAVSDAAYASGNHGWNKANPKDVVPAFRDDVACHPSVVAPLKDTPLYAMCEQLIGKDQAWQPQRAQVAYREPSEYWRAQGWNEHTPPNADGWHIDGGPGKYGHYGSPFSMLVCVCLSHGQEANANRGQFLVWPKSHHALHVGVAERVRSGAIKDPHSIFAGSRAERPNIGAPIRCLLRPGDAVIAHQRLGHAGGENLGPYVRKNIYLRVMNRNHHKFLESGAVVNGSVWTEYSGVRMVLRKYGLHQ